MNRNKMMATLVLQTILLAGCASNSQFDCPMKPGVRCENLDSVNAKVDSGEIGSEGVVDGPCLVHTPCNPQKARAFSCAGPQPSRPLRYGETVQHIWVAPFEDTSGNYHQESDVYAIARPGHWIGRPVKATNEEGQS